MSTGREVDALEVLPETDGKGQALRIKLAEGKTYVFHDVELVAQPMALGPGETVVRVTAPPASEEPMTEQQRQYYDWLMWL